MKVIQIGALACLVGFQGCSDDSTDDTATTTAVPTTTEPDVLQEPTCEKATPKGTMTIETRRHSEGFSLSRVSCDYYDTYNEILDSNIGDVSDAMFGEIDRFFRLERLGLMKDGKKYNITSLAEEFIAEGKNSGFIDNVKEGLESIKKQIGNDEFSDLFELDHATEFDSDAIVDEFLEDVEKGIQSFSLEHGSIAGTRVRDIIFDECTDVFKTVSGSFGPQMDIDTFCDPSRPPITDTTCTLTGKNSTVVLDRQQGWEVSSFQCDSAANADAQAHFQNFITKFEVGTFGGDAAFHYMSCEMLQTGREFFSFIADVGCKLHAPPCSKESTGGKFEISLAWNSTLAEKMLKYHGVDKHFGRFKDFEKELSRGIKDGLDGFDEKEFDLSLLELDEKLFEKLDIDLEDFNLSLLGLDDASLKEIDFKELDLPSPGGDGELFNITDIDFEKLGLPSFGSDGESFDLGDIDFEKLGLPSPGSDGESFDLGDIDFEKLGLPSPGSEGELFDRFKHDLDKHFDLKFKLSAYMVDTVRCNAYPDFMADLMLVMEKTMTRHDRDGKDEGEGHDRDGKDEREGHDKEGYDKDYDKRKSYFHHKRGFSSCDEAEQKISKLLGGWNLDEFCDASKVDVPKNETTCSMTSEDSKYQFQLDWNVTTSSWSATSASCMSEASDAALAELTSYIGKWNEYGTFAAAFNRMTCEMMQGKIEEQMFFSIAKACKSSSTTTSLPPATTTEAPVESTTTAGAVLL